MLEESNEDREELLFNYDLAMNDDSVPCVLRKDLDHVVNNNMNTQEAREYLRDKNKDKHIFINLYSICDVQGMDINNCEFYFSIQGSYLNNKEFFCTDIIHIKMHENTVDFKLINVFDNIEKRNKTDVPDTKKIGMKFWIVFGSTMGIIMILSACYFKFRKKHTKLSIRSEYIEV